MVAAKARKLDPDDLKPSRMALPLNDNEPRKPGTLQIHPIKTKKMTAIALRARLASSLRGSRKRLETWCHARSELLDGLTYCGYRRPTFLTGLQVCASRSWRGRARARQLWYSEPCSDLRVPAAILTVYLNVIVCTLV